MALFSFVVVEGSDRSPSDAVAAQSKVEVTLARFEAVRSEIQWRGVQRDAMVIFAFTLVGVILGSVDKVGPWILLAALPITYLASMWLHHDRRVGSLASYLLEVLEPTLRGYDQLPGLEEYLNSFEPTRRKGKHFTSVMARLLFPTLQLALLGTGVGMFISKGPLNPNLTVLVIVAGVVILMATALTFAKVKHIRK